MRRVDHSHANQSFLGRDRRALIQGSDESVDIDEPIDLYLAEVILWARGGTAHAHT